MFIPCRTRRLPAIAVPVAVLCLVLFSQVAHAGLNRWTPIGPSAAHGITRVTADPHDPAILYAQTSDFRLWRSRDGGASWAPIDAGLPGFVRAFAADGVASGVLYAVVGSAADGSLSVWTSTNRGGSWNRVFQGSGGAARIELTADPRTRGTLYQLADGTLSKSTDGGRTWRCIPVLFGCGTGPTLILTGFTVDPASSERLYAINNVGLVYRSTDGGATWSDGAVLQPLFGLGVNRIAVSPSDPEIVYAWVSGGGVTGRPCFARSDDRGESWTGVLTGVRCGELSVDPEDGQTLRILVGTERRLWTSRDGGRTWTQGRLAPASGQILPDPADPGALLLAGTEGLFRSENEGRSWTRWALRGFNNTGFRVLLASSEAPGVLYASLAVSPSSALPRPLLKSTDAGQTWTELPVRGVGALAIDPRDPRHLYAVTELEENRVRVNRVHESTDGGLSWQLAAERPFPALTSFGTVRVTGLRVHSMDGRIVYATTEGGGVFRSTDRGRTWRSANQGLPVQTQCGASACPANAAREIAQDRNPRIFYVVFEGDVYRSTNQGATWTPASEGLPPSGIVALAADPDRSGVLYAAGAVPQTSAGFISAIFMSTDGGRHWTRVAAYPSNVLDLAVSRSGVYASTRADGVFRSTDGGRSWTGVSVGLPDAAIPLLAADPLVPGRVYAGTAGEGAWAVRFVP
jgi:photosystem II stability/assembly factor-like uncharacterized protein